MAAIYPSFVIALVFSNHVKVNNTSMEISLCAEIALVNLPSLFQLSIICLTLPEGKLKLLRRFLPVSVNESNDSTNNVYQFLSTRRFGETHFFHKVT